MQVNQEKWQIVADVSEDLTASIFRIKQFKKLVTYIGLTNLNGKLVNN